MGIDPIDLANAPRKGHLGVVGLQERANAVKGTIRVDSVPGEGSEGHVRVPARSAYA